MHNRLRSGRAKKDLCGWTGGLLAAAQAPGLHWTGLGRNRGGLLHQVPCERDVLECSQRC